MLQIAPFERHVAEYDEWFERYPFVYESELAALRQQMLSLPENLLGLEVGVGTGRYAAPLGIKEGIEPSEEMANGLFGGVSRSSMVKRSSCPTGIFTSILC